MENNERRWSSLFSGADLFGNMLLFFFMLFVVAIVYFNPITKKKDGIQLNEKFLVIVSWEDDSRDDVDTYVKDPEDHLVYFRRREDGLMILNRDDIGITNDTVTTQDGKTIYLNKNEEIVMIRGIVPGEYIVNAHMYYKKGTKPATVTVRLVQLQGQDSDVISETFTLEKNGDERTAFRFTLDTDGNVTNTNKEQMSLFQFRVRGGDH